jgi:hypothetical protein
MIAIMIVVMVVVTVMVAMIVRAIGHAVVTIPPLVTRAVAMLVFDHASRHQAQCCKGDE